MDLGTMVTTPVEPAHSKMSVAACVMAGNDNQLFVEQKVATSSPQAPATAGPTDSFNELVSLVETFSEVSGKARNLLTGFIPRSFFARNLPVSPPRLTARNIFSPSPDQRRLEDLIFLIYSVSRSRSVKDVVISLLWGARRFTTDQDVFDLFHGIVQDFVDRWAPEYANEPVSWADSVSNFADLIDKCSAMPLSSPLFKPVGQLITVLVAKGFLADAKASLLWSGVVQAKDLDDWEKGHDVFTRYQTVLQAASSLMRTIAGTGPPAAVTDEATFIHAVVWLDANKHKLTQRPDLEKTLTAVDVWEAKSEEAWQYALRALKARHSPAYNDAYRKLVTVRASHFDTAEVRRRPFNIFLHGLPGTGKNGLLVDGVFSVLARELGLPEEVVKDPRRYTSFQTASEKYMSSVKPGHMFLVLDELGSAQAKMAGQGSLMNELVSILGEETYYPPRAEVDDKGKFALNNLGCICLSNLPDGGASAYISEMSAFWRRFSLIARVTVDPNYQNASGGLDISKVPPEGCIDYLRFQLQFHHQGRAADAGTGRLLTLSEFFDMVALVARRHKDRTDRLAGSRGLQHDMIQGACPACNLINCACDEDRYAAFLAAVNFGPSRAREPAPDPPEDLELEPVSLVSFQSTPLWSFFLVWFERFTLWACSSGFLPALCLVLVLLTLLTDTPPSVLALIVLGAVSYRAQSLIDPEALAERVAETTARAEFIADRLFVFGSSLDDFVFKAELATAAIKQRAAWLAVFLVSAAVLSYGLSCVFASDNTPTAGADGGNVWHTPQPYITGGKQHPQSGFEALLAKNTKLTRIHYPNDSGTTTEISHLTGICATNYIGVRHALQKLLLPGAYLTYLTVINGVVSESNPVFIDHTCYAEIPGTTDLSLVRLDALQNVRDLTQYLFVDNVPSTAFSGLSCSTVFYDCTDRKIGGLKSVCGETAASSYDVRFPTGPKKIERGWVMRGHKGFSGKCGSPLAVHTGRKQQMTNIVGFQTAANLSADDNLYEFCNKRQVMEAIGRIKSIIIQPVSRSDSEGLPEDFSLETPTHRSGLSYVTNFCNMIPLGFAPRAFVARFKSDVVKFWDGLVSELTELDPRFDHGLVAPSVVVTKTTVDGVTKQTCPYSNMLEEYKSQIHSIDHSNLSLTIDHVARKFGQSKEFSQCHTVDIDTAINGKPNTFASSIPRGTAAGWPMSGAKCDHLIVHEDGSASPTPELRQQVEDTIARIQAGDGFSLAVRMALKDEPRAPSKIAKGSIRGFAPANMIHIIISKMVMGMFINAFTAGFNAHETSAGANCFSPDWKQIWERLRRHPCVLNGDFEKYDKKLSCLLILAAFTVVELIMERNPWWSHFDTVLLRAVASSVAFATVVIGKDVVAPAGGLSSGVLMTFLINNIVNSLLFRLAYIDLSGMSPLDALDHFEEHVEACFHGDDSTLSNAVEVSHFYNHHTLQIWFGEHGIRYTSADKGAFDKAFYSQDLQTLCKRRWVPFEFEGVQLVLCPIELASIGKMLGIGVRSKVLTFEAQKRLLVDGVWFELSQHPEIYHEASAIVERHTGVKAPLLEDLHREQAHCAPRPWVHVSVENLEGEPVSLESVKAPVTGERVYRALGNWASHHARRVLHFADDVVDTVVRRVYHACPDPPDWVDDVIDAIERFGEAPCESNPFGGASRGRETTYESFPPYGYPLLPPWVSRAVSCGLPLFHQEHAVRGSSLELDLRDSRFFRAFRASLASFDRAFYELAYAAGFRGQTLHFAVTYSMSGVCTVAAVASRLMLPPCLSFVSVAFWHYPGVRSEEILKRTHPLVADLFVWGELALYAYRSPRFFPVRLLVSALHFEWAGMSLRSGKTSHLFWNVALISVAEHFPNMEWGVAMVLGRYLLRQSRYSHEYYNGAKALPSPELARDESISETTSGPN